MQNVVILGTGGTIAGTGADPDRVWDYRAGQLSIAQLVKAMPDLAVYPTEVVQVAQVDSKDMSWQLWQDMGRELQRQLARDDVSGIVIAHGTDTLEETAYLLHRLVDGRKPVVITAAMRPATAPDADGPRNLLDAVRVALEAARRGLGGVVAVMHGGVWAGSQVRKMHSWSLDAFDAGGQAPLALIDAQGQWHDEVASWPASGNAGWWPLNLTPPRVEIIHSHADADGWMVDAALAHAHEHGPLKGLVMAGTGHGTLHKGLEAALAKAVAHGVTVWRSSRVARGGVQSREGDAFVACGELTAAQARVALMLYLMGV
ncbi:MAG TPA: asparaginase [Aquabacterium sp.]|uniref:asparaginase n=1 Tax=Aquabacterium sp. TaxID=1872578 RepID=UPI002E31B741|nr:asparaginase [Aquabacterium sp.]HEX5357258.1 asparaginase [Aquabacterium sp.]